MVTDDERRRVVVELRSVDMFDGFTFGCRWAELIFGEKPKCVEQRLRCGDCATRALRYLADLIEPSCDRDALLALADEMQRELDECASGHEIAGNLQSQIDRIREACGTVFLTL